MKNWTNFWDSAVFDSGGGGGNGGGNVNSDGATWAGPGNSSGPASRDRNANTDSIDRMAAAAGNPNAGTASRSGGGYTPAPVAAPVAAPPPKAATTTTVAPVAVPKGPPLGTMNTAPAVVAPPSRTSTPSSVSTQSRTSGTARQNAVDVPNSSMSVAAQYASYGAGKAGVKDESGMSDGRTGTQYGGGAPSNPGTPSPAPASNNRDRQASYDFSTSPAPSRSGGGGSSSSNNNRDRQASYDFSTQPSWSRDNNNRDRQASYDFDGRSETNSGFSGGARGGSGTGGSVQGNISVGQPGVGAAGGGGGGWSDQSPRGGFFNAIGLENPGRQLVDAITGRESDRTSVGTPSGSVVSGFGAGTGSAAGTVGVGGRASGSVTAPSSTSTMGPPLGELGGRTVNAGFNTTPQQTVAQRQEQTRQEIEREKAEMARERQMDGYASYPMDQRAQGWGAAGGVTPAPTGLAAAADPFAWAGTAKATADDVAGFAEAKQGAYGERASMYANPYLDKTAPQLQAMANFSSLIGKAESRALGYEDRRPQAPKDVVFEQKTVREMMDFAARYGAVGWYQLTNDKGKGTFAAIVEKTGLNPDVQFTPQVQDFIGMALAQERANRATDKATGKIDPVAFGHELAGEWAGFQSPATGKGRYDNDKYGNKASAKANDVLNVARDMIATGAVKAGGKLDANASGTPSPRGATTSNTQEYAQGTGTVPETSAGSETTGLPGSQMPNDTGTKWGQVVRDQAGLFVDNPLGYIGKTAMGMLAGGPGGSLGLGFGLGGFLNGGEGNFTMSREGGGGSQEDVRQQRERQEEEERRRAAEGNNGGGTGDPVDDFEEEYLGGDFDTGRLKPGERWGRDRRLTFQPPANYIYPYQPWSPTPST
jgi:hypothetical protein